MLGLGAAIQVFEGARALEVDRSRFLPVKTTNDLLVLRSDVYAIGSDARLRRQSAEVPLVDLDSAHYKRIDDFDRRFPVDAPSLVGARSLTVRGDWTFGANVTVVGEAVLDGAGEPSRVPDGARLGV
jgi:UTP--glucose-1-phosphate uridylyltransferase